MDMGTRGYVYALGKRLRGREERGCPKFRTDRSRRPRGWRDGKCTGHWALDTGQAGAGGQQGAQVACGRRGDSSRVGVRGLPRPRFECCHWLELANQQGSVSLDNQGRELSAVIGHNQQINKATYVSRRHPGTARNSLGWCDVPDCPLP